MVELTPPDTVQVALEGRPAPAGNHKDFAKVLGSAGICHCCCDTTVNPREFDSQISPLIK